MGRLSEKSYIIRLRKLLNHKIIFTEHIVCAFPENIITRFDVSVNDVAEEFAKKLRIGSLARFYLFFLCFNLIIKRKMSKLNLTNDKNDDILYDR